MAVLIAAAVCAALTACGASGSPAAGRLEVAAAFYPLEWLTRQVGGADVTVTGLTKPGVEPHDVELTPRQVADVYDADLIVYVSGLQPAVDEAADPLGERAFDAADAVPMLPGDPHVWLDPSRMAVLATTLGDRLAAEDPPRAAGYRDRAAATSRALRALDEDYLRGLAPCASRTIVTGHAAFGYLASRYRLEQISVSGVDPESEP